MLGEKDMCLNVGIIGATGYVGEEIIIAKLL